MKNKILAIGSIMLTAISFFMMVDTKYFGALGDYIIQGMGLKAWSGNGNLGTHLTIFYFLIPLIIGLIGVNKYCHLELKLSKMKIFIIICIILFVFTAGLNEYAEWIKREADGLLSIEVIWNESEHYFNANDEEITEFGAEIKLKNHSNERREFYLGIKEPNINQKIFQTHNEYGAIAYGNDNTPLLIALEPKSVSRIKVNFKNDTNEITFESDTGSSGRIDNIVLYNDNEAVLFSYGQFLGSLLKK
ncbi:hypothetical protein [Maledivibacter halophilus]|uniref:Uncharacterized protein n=1 Tax=Maledivibacter halophilus TaxID=36842 RepID=A0A1T5LVG9_9FIRM|nr:hypothetical protein [Maledivibacter halophilus]SKC79987.1 hypothetical protein SAMN02194393_03405 [Maledivibacter halophilus]